MANIAEKPLFKKIVLVVVAALIDAGKHVLVQRRPAAKSLAGKWEFPGGKVEHDEQPAAALVREVRKNSALSSIPARCSRSPSPRPTLMTVTWSCCSTPVANGSAIRSRSTPTSLHGVIWTH
jgi:hypothetical protein